MTFELLFHPARYESSIFFYTSSLHKLFSDDTVISIISHIQIQTGIHISGHTILYNNP